LPCSPLSNFARKIVSEGGGKTIIQLVENCIPLLCIPIFLLFLYFDLRLLLFKKEIVMKRTLYLLICLLCYVTADAQSMKVVIDSKGEELGRLVRTNTTTYTVSLQDDYDVPKAGNRVVTYSADKGQGIIYRHPDRSGNINVRKGPSIKSAVVAKIPDPGHNLPDPYDCLGKVNGWYKIKIDGKIGYVREDLVCWDAICTF
jgi:hypothetical protein